MAVNRVVYGSQTLIDLTGNTVTPETLLAGTRAHNRAGQEITGTASNAILTVDSDGNGRLRGVTMLMDSAGSTTIT